MTDIVSGVVAIAAAGYVAYDLLSGTAVLDPDEMKVVVADLVFAPRLLWNPRDQCLYVADEWGSCVWRQRISTDGQAEGVPEAVLRTAPGPGNEPRALGLLPGGALLVGHYGGALAALRPGRPGAPAAAAAAEQEPLMDVAVDDSGGAYCAGAWTRIMHVPVAGGDGAMFSSTSRAILSGAEDSEAARSVAASGLVMPWGLALAADGRMLLCSQVQSGIIWAWDRDPANGRLSNYRIWAEVPGALCSGLCLDAEGCAWVAVSGLRGDAMSWNCLAGGPLARQRAQRRAGPGALRGGFLRVRQGGKVLQRVLLRGWVGLGCALGGPGGSTLYMAVAKQNLRERRAECEPGNSVVLAMPVEVGAAGSPAASGAPAGGGGAQPRSRL